MTRKERALKNSQAQYEKAHKKIMSLITGIFKDDYKKKNGKWHISKIANDLGMSRDTIRKHLKDEGLI
jgi:transcriptional regulator of acetoin/glycerol metabolism